MRSTLGSNGAANAGVQQGTQTGGSCAAHAHGSNTGNVSVFVGVLSKADNFATRRAVRHTWGSDVRLGRVVFSVLRPASNETFSQLRAEAAEHGDIIVTSEVADAYNNLTYATLALFRAAAVNADRMTHLFKTDDDCYINVALLLDALHALPRTRLYSGYNMRSHEPIRCVPCANSVPYSNWASDEPFPRYGYGLGYLLSMDVVQRIAAGVPHVVMRPNSLLVVEDTAVGVWVDHIVQRDGYDVTYDLSMEAHINFGRGCNNRTCRHDDIVSHIVPDRVNATIPDTLECLHQQGTTCCACCGL